MLTVAPSPALSSRLSHNRAIVQLRSHPRVSSRPLTCRRNAQVILAMADFRTAVPTPKYWENKKVVICGAGVIGTSIAYQLSLKGVTSTLIDPKGIAPAASGKAGGFLALDWNDKTKTEQLSRVSFEMHQELARTLGLESYRRLSCHAVALDEEEVMRKPSSRKMEQVEWADLGIKGARLMGTENTIAQVHPLKLTEAMYAAAEARGTRLLHGSVKRVGVDEMERKVTGVQVDDTFIPADVVVIAMGPWSAQAAVGLPIPTVYGQKYHSVIMKSQRVLNQAVFFQGCGDPEVYPRPDGDVYVTGFPDSPEIINEKPGEVEVREDVCRDLVNAVRQTSSEMESARLTKLQSCHLPVSMDGDPIMGAVPGVEGAYVATGHSCWGILNSPGSGLAMAELILNGKSSTIDISAFSPERFFATQETGNLW